jgi:hypothetical protein
MHESGFDRTRPLLLAAMAVLGLPSQLIVLYLPLLAMFAFL